MAEYTVIADPTGRSWATMTIPEPGVAIPVPHPYGLVGATGAPLPSSVTYGTGTGHILSPGMIFTTTLHGISSVSYATWGGMGVIGGLPGEETPPAKRIRPPSKRQARRARFRALLDGLGA